MVVSFVVVAYNEERSLGKLLACLQRQTYPHQKIEVILVDSASTDRTKVLMTEFAETSDFLRVIVIDNPRRMLPCGWNLALAEVRGEGVIRLDAHASMPDDFIEKNVNNLEKGQAISCGRVESVFDDADNWKNTVNLAENSMFGGSAASFRRAEKPGYVSTGAFAMYRREVFDTAGRYNEHLARTEDNEMHYRMKQAGYQFYFDPAIVSYRQTRQSFGKLLKQKYLNGYWIGLTMGVEPRCFSLYHFVPVVFVLGILLTAVLAAFGIWQLAALMWALYGVVAVGMALLSAIGSPDRSLYCLLLPVMFLCLHVGYGLGTLIGIVKMPFWKKKWKAA